MTGFFVPKMGSGQVRETSVPLVVQGFLRSMSIERPIVVLATGASSPAYLPMD